MDEKRYAVIALRKVLEVNNRVYCIEFVQTYAGHLPVIELLCNGDAGSKANAAAVLRSLIALSSSKETLVKAGVIPPLIALLRDGDADGSEQAGRRSASSSRAAPTPAQTVLTTASPRAPIE